MYEAKVGWDLPSLFLLLQPQGNERLLEIGSGNGNFARGIAGFVKTVVSVDKRQSVRNKLQLIHLNCLFVEEDAHYATYSAPFDSIVIINTLHFLNVERILQRYAQYLKKGGRLLIFEPTKWSTFYDPLLNKESERRTNKLALLALTQKKINQWYPKNYRLIGNGMVEKTKQRYWVLQRT